MKPHSFSPLVERLGFDAPRELEQNRLGTYSMHGHAAHRMAGQRLPFFRQAEVGAAVLAAGQ